MSDGTNATQDPNAQGAGADVNQEGQSEKANGIQQRIDELTRQAREAERAAQLQAQQFQQAMAQKDAQMQELLIAVTARGTQETGPEILPEEKQKFDFLLSPLQKQLEELRKTNQQLLQGFQAQQEASRVAQVALPTDTPEVKGRAQELFTRWKAGGLPLTVEDALRFARGEAFEKGTLTAGAANQQRSEFNGSSQGVMQHGAPPAPQRTPQGRKPRPANFADLPPEQRAEILEAEGVGDREW